VNLIRLRIRQEYNLTGLQSIIDEIKPYTVAPKGQFMLTRAEIGRSFITFRKGLDAADKVSYPEDKFGAADINNTDRYLAICNGYKELLRHFSMKRDQKKEEIWLCMSEGGQNLIGRFFLYNSS
jgi:hypothetical protein